MTEATLEVKSCVFLRVEGIFTGLEGLVRKIFVMLMDFCRVLDIWTATVIENVDGLPSDKNGHPFRGLGSNNPVPEQQQSACESLREMLR